MSLNRIVKAFNTAMKTRDSKSTLNLLVKTDFCYKNICKVFPKIPRSVDVGKILEFHHAVINLLMHLRDERSYEETYKDKKMFKKQVALLGRILNNVSAQKSIKFVKLSSEIPMNDDQIELFSTEHQIILHIHFLFCRMRRQHLEHRYSSHQPSECKFFFDCYGDMFSKLMRKGRIPTVIQRNNSLLGKKLCENTIDELITRNPNEICPICLDREISASENFCILDGCHHLICVSCAEAWFFDPDNKIK